MYWEINGSSMHRHFREWRSERWDMKKYNNTTQNADGYRQLCFYRIIQEADHSQPEDASLHPNDNLNLNACFHIYTSDRNSLFLIQRALGYQDRKSNNGLPLTYSDPSRIG